MSSIVTFGEVLMRMTAPNKVRMKETNSFQRSIGGAEANVSVSLANFGHKVSFFSAVPPNSLGENVVEFLHAHHVNTRHVYTHEGRLGLYFVEEGFSMRGPQVTYDRAHSSFVNLVNETCDWDELFEGVELFHVSGITPALSEKAKSLTISAVKEAKHRNITVSFDCNYRSKLWTTEEAKEAFEAILPYVDVCFAGYKDFVHILGYDSGDTFSEASLKEFYREASSEYSIHTFACTNRTVQSANQHQLTAYLYQNDQLYSQESEVFDVMDRIGGGDAFAAGIIHANEQAMKPQQTVAFGLASGLLKHTIAGDHNQFNADEVAAFMNQVNQDVTR
ncbi:sugar kinase [Halobacillus ihumii]|uniref:sugar kinase n=1 Tax=Halobacillus ihumii TaxID=2686092 RepID=UPI0013D80DF9|nr:sugar kinase [Halobacillus ihumii]